MQIFTLMFISGSDLVFVIHIMIMKQHFCAVEVFQTICLLNKQMSLLFQIVTAAFYVNKDLIMISQFVYCKLKNQKVTKGKFLQQLKCSPWYSIIFTERFSHSIRIIFFFQRDQKIECTNSGVLRPVASSFPYCLQFSLPSCFWPTHICEYFPWSTFSWYRHKKCSRFVESGSIF